MRDVARAQLQPSNAVLLRWEPPGPIPRTPLHRGTETAWHRHSQTQAASALVPAQRPAAKHSSTLRGHVHGEEVAARTIFPGLNAIQVRLGEIRRFLAWML